MSLARDIGGEVVKALSVLALIFLSFVHQRVELPVSSFDGAVLSISEFSMCGKGHDGEAASHAPCHACRPNLADLLQPPCLATPAFDFSAPKFAQRDSIGAGRAGYLSSNPRAPPIPA